MYKNITGIITANIIILNAAAENWILAGQNSEIAVMLSNNINTATILVTTDGFGSVIGFTELYFFQWLFQPIQGPGLLFSSAIIFHRR
jgi:hypothetical protein